MKMLNVKQSPDIINIFLRKDDSLSGKSISSSSWRSAADSIYHMLSLLYQAE